MLNHIYKILYYKLKMVRNEIFILEMKLYEVFFTEMKSNKFHFKKRKANKIKLVELFWSIKTQIPLAECVHFATSQMLPLTLALILL